MISRSPVGEYAYPRTRMTDRNQICPNGTASTVTDVLAKPCKWQMPFLGRGDVSKRIVNKFRRLAILQLEHRRPHCKQDEHSDMAYVYH